MWLFELFFPQFCKCRSMDISKYFRESLGIRDNESRLYKEYIEDAQEESITEHSVSRSQTGRVNKHT